MEEVATGIFSALKIVLAICMFLFYGWLIFGILDEAPTSDSTYVEIIVWVGKSLMFSVVAGCGAVTSKLDKIADALKVPLE